MLFNETQVIRKPTLYIVLGVVWLFCGGVLYVAGGLLWPQLLVSAVFAATLLLLYLSKLSIGVGAAGISVGFAPFAKQNTYLYGDIAAIKIHPISPLLDYGGWGYRWMPLANGKAYIMQGNMGATLVLKNQREIAFSLNDAEGFKNAVQLSAFAGKLTF